MIQSITVKCQKIVIIELIWQNGQMVTQTLNSEYNVFSGTHDIAIIHVQDIEPTRGKLIATCLFDASEDCSNVVLNAETYDVTAVNTDGCVKTYTVGDNSSEKDVGLHHTVIEEKHTRHH